MVKDVHNTFKKAYKPTSRIQFKCRPETGRTMQEFADEADINNLVNHWLKTGQMPVWNTRQPIYADVSEIPSFDDIHNMSAHAKQVYDQLPDEVKSEFGSVEAYLDAILASEMAENDVGTEVPLDVTVPTDTTTLKEGEKDGSLS